MRTIRFVTAAALVASAVLFATAAGFSQQAGSGPPCGQTTFSSDGVTWRVLFAKNGAVQQYLLETSSHNQEKDHDGLVAAQTKYGPEAINAPPVRIISFKPADGGMMIPDKAEDSCGRITHFH